MSATKETDEVTAKPAAKKGEARPADDSIRRSLERIVRATERTDHLLTRADRALAAHKA